MRKWPTYGFYNLTTQVNAKNKTTMYPAIDFVQRNFETRGGATDINEALKFSLKVAKKVKQNDISPETEQLIVFLTDGNATYGVTDRDQIKENVKNANKDLKIPIYGIALGEDADFDLIRDISDESGGFVRKIYESGDSVEQLEYFFKEVGGKYKLLTKITKFHISEFFFIVYMFIHFFILAFIGKDIKFDYLVNGQKLAPSCLTENRFDKLLGSNGYSVAGTCLSNIEIKEFESQATWTENGRERKSFKKIVIDKVFEDVDSLDLQSHLENQSEEFMKRLWAYKRIKHMLANNNSCTVEAPEGNVWIMSFG